MNGAPIQSQVRLPLAVACDVVLQGIRIRLGRSLVTMTGIVLGIAFLMSIVAGQLARDSVRHEQQLRTELQRVTSFLTAESGPLAGRTLGLLSIGPLSEIESRLVAALARQQPQQIRWAAAVPPPRTGPAAQFTVVAPAQVAHEASAVVVLGGSPPPDLDWSAMLATARQPVVAFTRQPTGSAPAGVTWVALSRELRPEDRAAAAAEARRARFRTGWIVVIALMVTVIGIANSMLMSVTERFREIGTMKCLGALSSFIRQLFIIESSLMGAVGAAIGAVFGSLFALAIYGLTYDFGMVLSSLAWGRLGLYGLAALLAGILLAILAALYPASFAARMVPATALRTNV